MKYQTQYNHKVCFMILIVLFSLHLSNAFTITDASLQLAGASLQGSLRGGTKLILTGQFDPSLTDTDYSVTVGSYPCTVIPASGLTGQLICRTSDSLSSKDLSSLDITVTEEPTRQSMKISKTFTYSASKTPFLTKIFPSSSYGGNVLYFQGKHRITDIGDKQRNFGDLGGDVYGLIINKKQCSRLEIGDYQIDGSQNIDGTFSISPDSSQRIACFQDLAAQAGNFNILEFNPTGYSDSDQFFKKTQLNSADNYQFTVVPAVSGISAHFGSNLGKQQLLIQGTGFSIEKEKNRVTVDGINCNIMEVSNKNIRCNIEQRSLTAPHNIIETNSLSQIDGYISGSGFQYERYAFTGSLSISTFRSKVLAKQLVLKQKSIRQSLESDNVYGQYFGQIFKGYFVAPVTGDYTFFGQGNEHFEMYMGESYGSAQTPTQKIIYSYAINTGNFYDKNISTAWSAPITMNASDLYYIEVYHVNHVGDSMLSIGVQIPNDDPSLYWQTHQVNQIQTKFTNQPQRRRFTISNVIGGKYNLTYGTNTIRVNYNASSTQFADALRTLYRIGVTAIRTANSLDSDPSTFEEFVYDVTIDLLRTEASQQTLLGPPKISQTIFMAGKSMQLTQEIINLHGPLISGYFTVDIGSQPLLNGASVEIPFNIAATTLQNLIRAIPGLQKTTVMRTGDPNYGARWIIDFLKYNNDVPDLDVSGIGLTGGKTGTTPQIQFWETRKFSSNLLMNPIDNRLMRTPASVSQLNVFVNQIMGACTGDCSFEFNTSVPQLASVSLSGSTVTLSVADTANEGYTIADLQQVTLDGTLCTINSGGTLASFTCQLQLNVGSTKPILTAGNHLPKIRVANIGQVYNPPSVTPVTVNLAASSVAPTSGNNNGGQQIIVSGWGFPLDKTKAQITLCGSTATIVSMNNIQFTIIAPQCSNTGTQNIQILYNGQSATIGYTYNLAANPPSITGITPTSANPTLKAVMQITGTGFGTIANDVSVFLSNSSGRVYQMKVLEMNQTFIKVGIPGGLPGNFKVIVDIASFGQAVASPSTANNFKYELVMNTINPNHGSHFGGTLINITGVNFSPEKSQTQVFVGIEKNWFCKLEEVTTDYITCRTPPRSQYYDNPSNTIYLYNKLIQTAECPSNACNFTYDDSTIAANIDSLSIGSGKFGDTLEITGANFQTNSVIVFTSLNSGKVTVANPTSPLNSTNAVTTIPQLQAGDYKVVLRSDPSGQSSPKLFKTNMQLLSASPTNVSSFGGNVIISGHGLPTSWPSNTFTITLKRGTSIVSAQVLSSSETQLKLKIPASSTDQTYTLTIKSNDKQEKSITFYQRASGTPQLTLTSSSSINPLTVQTIILGKSSFSSLKPSELYLYQQINPSKNINIDVSTVSSNSTSLSFTQSLSSGVYKIKAFYTEQGWAFPTFTITVTAASGSISPLSSPVLMSYNGGTFTVSGNSISEAAIIQIAGKKGYVLSTTSTEAIFSVPPLITKQSIAQFKELSMPQKITKFTTFSDGSNQQNSFDNNFLTTYSSTNPTCYIGIDMGSDFNVQITRIRYFPDKSWPIPLKFLIDGVFQVSNDNSSWTDFYQIDNSVHTGWNSYLSQDTNTYKYVRFTNTLSSGCNLAEIEIYGYMVQDVSNTDLNSKTLDVLYNDGVTMQTFTGAIEYSSSSTPIITGVSPKNGNVFGGYNITLTGSNLGGTPSVKIDGIQCDVQTSDATSIICTTRSRLTFPDKISFTVMIDNKNAIIRESFMYVLRWSDPRTWGTDMPPIEGDLVYVPKGMVLYMDQSTPILEGIIVQGGQLLFADEKDMVISAKFITVLGGKFTAGTETNNYHHKLQFVMYGDYYGKQQPEFGNKGIGCKQCKFSMYGTERTPTWTLVANSSTISPGDTSFTVVDDISNWKAGDKIVVASTSFDHNEAQQRIIKSVIGKTITIQDPPFKYQHLGILQTYGAHDLDMRAQVGLLTRNIIVRGEDDSITKNYGSHLMLAGSAERGFVGHVAYTQFTKCGQPQIVGRYCIHFHMNGQVFDSYVKGNAVHHSMARILTLHAVQYLKVQKNVGYEVRGHNFFLEDGIEQNNLLQYNLAIKSQETSLMLQTDMSVASFWITNPFNHVRHNRAAGGDFYGFWYEIKEHPDGHSEDKSVCPRGMILGQSHDNVAHSNKRFGLRVFIYTARQRPCSPILQANQTTDPSKVNPSIESRFYNYILYKNGQSGLLAEETGRNIYDNFTTADNILSGMQFYTTNHSVYNTIAKNSAIIGRSSAITDPTEISKISSSSGIITPRTDGFLISGISFYNFQSNMAVLQVCSKCDSVKKFINTGRQVFVENIAYSSITSKYVKFNGHRKQIIYDTDASFTSPFDSNTRTSATVINKWKHFENQTSCVQAQNLAQWPNVIACDQTITIRRVMITNLIPQKRFENAVMKIQYLSDINETVDQNSADYHEIFSVLGTKQPMIDKKFAYAVPMATGRIYNIWWLSGLDFDHLAVDSSKFFTSDDDAIILKFNYYQQRQLYQIAPLFSNAFIRGSDINLDETTCANGDYFNNKDARYLQLCISGVNKTTPTQYLNVVGIKCKDFCPQPLPEFQLEKFIRVWGNKSQWINGVTTSGPTGQLPPLGANVTIPGSWQLLIEDEIIPELNILQINGIVRISDRYIDNRVLSAKSIWIRAGKLDIGYSSSQPFSKNLQIRLTGNKNDLGMVVDNSLAGNKLLVVSGRLNIYGKSPATTWTKLTSTLFATGTSMTVASTSGWNVGDELVIAPSFSNPKQYQKVQITGINSNTVTFTPAVNYTHFGSNSITINNAYGKLDTRASVGHITRNIKITAGADSGWGYRVMVNSFQDGDFFRDGSVHLQGVEFVEGGQYDTQKATLHFVKVGTSGASSVVKDSSFVDCKSYCINVDQGQNLQISDNVFYKGTLFHVLALDVTSKYTFSSNLMIGAHKRPTLTYSAKQEVSCYSSWKYQRNTDNIVVKDNVCQGSQGHGFVLPHMDCEQIDLSPYSNNLAGSCQIGFLLNKAVSASCQAGSGFLAYACKIGFMGHPPSVQMIKYNNFIMADNERAVTLRFGRGIDDPATGYLSNSYITAISRPTCSYCYGPDTTICSGNHAIRLLTTTVNGQKLPSKFGTGFDVICQRQTFDMKAYLSGNTFVNYNLQYSQSALVNCSHNVLFRPHSGASDNVGSHHLSNTTVTNSSVEAFGKFDPPSKGELTWFGGCGNILCTGKNNYLIEDHDGTFLPGGGTLIANNSVIADAIGCTKYDFMNGHHCVGKNDLGVLLYRNVAKDFNTRIMWPVYLNYEGGWRSETNGFKQWQWNGNQPLNKRLGMFISVVQYNKTYNMTFSSQPPQRLNLRFQQRYEGGNPNDWVIVKLHYPRPNSIQVRNKTGVVRPIPLLDNSAQSSLSANLTKCGNNKYFYHNYTIHFVLTAADDCEVTVQLTNNIQLTMHFQMPIADFFSIKGQTKLIDRMCALLDITDTSRVKVVGIFTGSTTAVVIVNSNGDSSDTAANAQLSAISNTINNVISDGSLNTDLQTDGFGNVLAATQQIHWIPQGQSSSQTQTQEANIVELKGAPIGLIVGLVIGVSVVVGSVTAVATVVYCLRKRSRIGQQEIMINISDEKQVPKNVTASEDSILDFRQKNV